MSAAAPDGPLQRIRYERRLAAEALGTALLLAIVVGSGIMGERLAGGNVAIALLVNAIATGAGLVVLIESLGPISGAHLNPAVTLVAWLRRDIDGRAAIAYAAAQTAGAIAGTITAHLMFARPPIEFSATHRDGPAMALSEFVATFGLIGTILGVSRARPGFVSIAVGFYIVAAYWFTASTAFANPAVTVARCLTATFSGIAPASAPAFIAAQIAGALAGWTLFTWLYREARPA